MDSITKSDANRTFESVCNEIKNPPPEQHQAGDFLNERRLPIPSSPSPHEQDCVCIHWRTYESERWFKEDLQCSERTKIRIPHPNNIRRGIFLTNDVYPSHHRQILMTKIVCAFTGVLMNLKDGSRKTCSARSEPKSESPTRTTSGGGFS